MEIYFSRPDEDNVSDDLNEALMVSVIRNLRSPWPPPQDYTARSNLMWAATMAENRVVKLGKQGDFQCHNMEHQLGAYTDCNHGQGLAVLPPGVLPAHLSGRPAQVPPVCPEGLGTAPGRAERRGPGPGGGSRLWPASSETWACPPPPPPAGGGAGQLKEIADSCGISPGRYRRMTHQEILGLLPGMLRIPL